MKYANLLLIYLTYLILLSSSSVVQSVPFNSGTGRRHTVNTNALKSVLNGKVWHITDVHYDWMYANGGDPSNMCHMDSKKKSYIVDKDNNNKRDRIYDDQVESGVASPVGNYKCDSPLLLVESSFQAMQKIEPNPDFIIWTGDDPPHVSSNELNQTLVLQSIQNMTDFIGYYFPGVPVYPSIGNHDSYPEHQVAVGPNWLLNGVAEMWVPWLTNESIATVKIGGYYTELVEPGFRIMSINTVYYYTQDKMAVNLTDPAGQLEWINQTLFNARAANELVWIIGHVPPGHNEKYNIANFHSSFNDPYLYAFSSYSDIIVAHFYGHQHSDTFRLYYNAPHKSFEDWVPNGVMFLSPSVTPWQTPYLPTLPNNPSVRMYVYNTTSYQLNDYEQYWSNLTANIDTNTIDWMLEYKATEFFRVSALDPLSMFESFMLMTQDTEMLNLFHLYNSVSYPTRGCDEVCKKIQLCSIQHLFTEGFEYCLIEGPNIKPKKHHYINSDVSPFTIN